jgi:ribose transport system permease protein
VTRVGILLSSRTSRVFLALVAIVAAAAILSPHSLRTGSNLFLSWDNLASILSQVALNGILAVGMTFVILLGAIDLSVGTVMALASIASAMLLVDRGWGAWAASLAALAIGAALGLTNGVLVAWGRVQSFVVTLGTMSVAFGLARLASDNERRDLHYGSGSGLADPAFEVLNQKIFGILPVSALLFLLVAGAGALVLRATVFGRHVHAVGSNAEAARLCGVAVERVTAMAFGIAGALAGLAGAVFTAQNEQGNPAGGTGKELDAIAAVVIGGTRLSGGSGSILGTVGGVLIIGVLNTALNQHNVDPNVQKILKGAIIVLAAIAQQGFPGRQRAA